MEMDPMLGRKTNRPFETWGSDLIPRSRCNFEGKIVVSHVAPELRLAPADKLVDTFAIETSAHVN